MSRFRSTRRKKDFLAKWNLGGIPGRVERVKLDVLEDEIRQLLARHSRGEPVAQEFVLKQQLRYYQDLEERLAGVPLHVAVESYLAMHQVAAVVPQHVSDLVEQFVARKRSTGKSTAYVKRLEIYLNRFKTKFGKEYLHRISSEMIAVWLGTLDGGLRHRKNFHGAVTTFFRWARDEKKALPGDKRTEPELLERIIVKRTKAVIYTPEEMKKIVAACAGELRDVVVLSGFCGLRSSEVTGEETDHPPLPCEAILFDFDQIRVSEQKVQSKGDRFAPLSPNAKKWLAELRDKTGSVWTGRRFDYHLKKACTTAGVTFRKNGLRKSWITYRMAIVKNANEVADEAGNSPSEIYRSYRRPELAHVAEAWFGIRPIR